MKTVFIIFASDRDDFICHADRVDYTFDYYGCLIFRVIASDVVYSFNITEIVELSVF